MTTQPGLQLRQWVLTALRLSKEGRETALEVCTKYSTCYQPARPFPHRSDSVKTVESFAQEEFQKEMLMRMKKLPCLEEDEATKLDVREAEGLWKQIMNDERSS